MINCVAMLTRNDITVPNAMEVVRENSHAKAEYWGFKDVGVTFEQGEALIQAMQAAGKKVVLEPLTRDEETANKWAQLAVRYHCAAYLGFFFKSVSDTLRAGGVLHFTPFGRRNADERLLGTLDELRQAALELIDQGAAGIRMSAYRWIEGDPALLASTLKAEFNARGVPFMMTGSVSDYNMLDVIREMQPWGITVGGALFDEGKFGGGTVAERIDRINEYCNSELAVPAAAGAPVR
ncbi:hypothetical protein [Feifania hominis]|uniref:4-hydroxythreonine-4-phosphate dehydrogenase n=1 Tax=Feifania hominis TaxID=2763660 RepID=A0A926HRB1_9FIRM|nr:hypothetical protein [Feifania hominis]MBC8537212.1 hypothetical protein [Feifania hominis]